MMVFSFKIPPVSGERLGYNMALLLSFVVLLNLIGESMPRVSKQVSYLQLYVSYQLSMSVVITMLSIWQVSLHFTKSKTTIPFILKLYFFFCRCRKPKSVASNNEEDDSSVRNTAASDNKEQIQSGMDNQMTLDEDVVTQSIDEILMWIFLTMFFMSTSLFLISIAI
jgi:hypothetical protein